MIGVNLERPSIFVWVNNPEESLLKEILAGIEEEGIPYDVKETNLSESNILKDIYAASQESRIGIAIGITNNRVVLQYNKLKEEKPLLDIKLNSYDKGKARIIGCNAARIYKVMPLKELINAEDDLTQRIRAAVMNVLENIKFSE